jgi:hypothetical protein
VFFGGCQKWQSPFFYFAPFPQIDKTDKRNEKDLMKTQATFYVKAGRPGVISINGPAEPTTESLFIYSDYIFRLHVIKKNSEYQEFSNEEGRFYCGITNAGTLVAETFYEDFGYETENGFPVLVFPVTLNNQVIFDAIDSNGEGTLTVSVWWTVNGGAYRTCIANFDIDILEPDCVPPYTQESFNAYTVEEQDHLFDSSSSSSESSASSASSNSSSESSDSSNSSASSASSNSSESTSSSSSGV